MCTVSCFTPWMDTYHVLREPMGQLEMQMHQSVHFRVRGETADDDDDGINSAYLAKEAGIF